MEASKVTIQQLLRPTETCTFIIHGTMRGAQADEECELAVVRHEGSPEHALFIFQVDSMGQLQVDHLIPINTAFDAKMQYSIPGYCLVEICSDKGVSRVFKLPHNTHTAVLFSVVKTAKDGFVNSSTASFSSSFSWLHGYEACRTGWDRFSKPHRTSLLIDFGDSDPSDQGEAGLPDQWPWAHIITPRSDGSTDVAKCESLVDEFDPLRQQSPADHTHSSHSTRAMSVQSSPQKTVSTSSRSSSIAVDRPKPLSGSLIPPPLSSLTAHQLLGKSNIRPCHSETNLTSLRNESRMNSKLSMYRSHDNLTEDKEVYRERHREPQESTVEKRNHRQCIVNDSRVYVQNSIPSERPQGSHSLNEEEEEEVIDNPFLEEKEPVGSPKRVHTSPENSVSEGVEMMKVEEEEDKKGKMQTKPIPIHTTVSTLVTPSSPGASSLDYKSRRMRSATTIPQSTPSNSTFYVEAPTEMPIRLREKMQKATVQASTAISNSPKLSRKKARSETVSVCDSNKSTWVTRYQPGVLLLSGSMRECLIQRQLQQHEADFCEWKKLRLFCGTWNVNGKPAMQRLDKFLLSDKHTPDIFAVGFQELDLSPEALIKNETQREDQWVSLVNSSLELVRTKKFIKVASIRLVGILLVVFAESSVADHITEVDVDTVATGILGQLGNKGGVAIRFNVYHSSLCIVNCHLAAHMDEVEKRNQDYHQIFSKLQFFKNTSLPYSVLDHTAVVWMGDLNYRVQVASDLTPDIIKDRVEKYQYSSLLRHDQLVVQQKQGTAFSQFTESKIDFKPTYKYDPSTNSWDTSEKHRAPAWCDRVLYYCEAESLSCEAYRSHPEMIISDHKPVSALFDFKVKVVIPEKEKEVVEHITWQLDKQENETMPQVSLDTLELKYSGVKFMVPQTHQITVTNTCRRPVHIMFLPTPDKEGCISKPWLIIKPETKIIMKDEVVKISLTVLVTPELASSLVYGKDNLEDILVLHLEGGKDFFISVSGDYVQTSFGHSLESLVQLHMPIREVPVGQLVDVMSSGSYSLSSSWAEYNSKAELTRSSAPSLDIPKELFQLVDHLKKYGLDEENLFDGGLTAEQAKIRDVVDSGGRQFAGSVKSVAAVLLTFLRALADPVVPHALHQRCMDCCNNPTLCKQVLLQMPIVHRRTFVFIITFLRQLLQHSYENQMEAKILAPIFGEVLLSMSYETRKTTQRKVANQMTKKKGLFVYQFLVNNLTVEYS